MTDPHATPAQPSRCPRGCLGPQQCLEKVTGRTYFDCLLRKPNPQLPDRAVLERIVEDRERDVRVFEERLLFVRRRLMAAKLDLAVARTAEERQ